MSFQLLNLDEISDNVDRSIVLKGKKHQMKDICVEEMIEAQRKISQVETQANQDPVEQMNAMLDMLLARFPSAERADFAGLSLSKLITLYKWLHTPPEQLGEEKPAA
jgi:hypothetical protein